MVTQQTKQTAEMTHNASAVYDATVPLRQRIMDTRLRIESDFIYFAEDLYTIWEDGTYMKWGFDSFREYVEDELHVKYRRARYFVSIAKAVKDLNLEWSEIESIGWTKARILLPFLRNLDADEFESWLTFADEHSVSELASEMKATKAIELTEASNDTTVLPESELISYTFKATPEQAQIINDTMEHAKRMFDVNSQMDALESIMYDWMMRAGTDITTLELKDIVKWVETTYDIEISTTKRD